jgi:hypothetical protein
MAVSFEYWGHLLQKKRWRHEYCISFNASAEGETALVAELLEFVHSSG